MEKKEVTTAIQLSAVDNNTKCLGLSGSELVQFPFSAYPEATESEKGLMGSADKKSNPSSFSLRRYIFTPYIDSKKACRIVFDASPVNGSLTIKVYGAWMNGISMGCIRKVIGFNLSSANVSTTNESTVYECSKTTAGQFYISDAFEKNGKACIDIINKNGVGKNPCLILIESFSYTVTAMENQEPLTENLTKNNRDETPFVLKAAPVSLFSNSEAVTPPENTGIQDVSAMQTQGNESPDKTDIAIAQIVAKQVELENRLSKLEGGGDEK